MVLMLFFFSFFGWDRRIKCSMKRMECHGKHSQMGGKENGDCMRWGLLSVDCLGHQRMRRGSHKTYMIKAGKLIITIRLLRVSSPLILILLLLIPDHRHPIHQLPSQPPTNLYLYLYIYGAFFIRILYYLPQDSKRK